MIHIFIGTKAQLIKMAPIMVALRERKVYYNFIHSGQHQETMNDILEDFGLPGPSFYIVDGPDIKVKSQVPKWLCICERQTRSSSKCWAGRRKGAGDIVLVHGDTLSTLVGALAAKRMGFQCGHVESGLRSFNIFHPFPEELVRLTTFRLADVLYCPDKKSLDNVASRGKRVVHTHGNTMLDATRISTTSTRPMKQSDYGIVSIHRYENIFRLSRFKWIIEKIIDISHDHNIIFIMHQPTEHRLRSCGLYERLDAEPGISLRKRMSYFEFSGILAHARFLITDGGSNQEESSYLGLPCLVMRKGSEREDGIGGNVVISDYSPKIVGEFIQNLEAYRTPPSLGKVSPSEIIANDLIPYY